MVSKPNQTRAAAPLTVSVPPLEAGSCPRSSFKRVNSPPELNLLNLFSMDPIHQHKRSKSAAGGKPANVGTLFADMSGIRPATSASAMSALQMGMDSMRSPCFVHKTFGGSINLERVLERCKAEEMTHHNLLQTATGVREVARQLGTAPI